MDVMTQFRVIRVVDLRLFYPSSGLNSSGKKYFNEKRNRYLDILI